MCYQLIKLCERTARKPHKCIWCDDAIQQGERYSDEASTYEGDFQHHRWHPECLEASREHFKNEEFFSPGEFQRGTCRQRI